MQRVHVNVSSDLVSKLNKREDDIELLVKFFMVSWSRKISERKVAL